MNINALNHYLTIKINIPTYRECPRCAAQQEERLLQCREQDPQHPLEPGREGPLLGHHILVLDSITEATNSWTNNIHVVTNIWETVHVSMNEKGHAVQHTEPFVHSPVYVNIDTEPVMDLAKVELLMNMMKASSEYTAPKASLRRLHGHGRDGGDEQVPQQARQDGVLKARNVQK